MDWVFRVIAPTSKINKSRSLVYKVARGSVSQTFLRLGTTYLNEFII